MATLLKNEVFSARRTSECCRPNRQLVNCVFSASFHIVKPSLLIFLLYLSSSLQKDAEYIITLFICDIIIYYILLRIVICVNTRG